MPDVSVVSQGEQAISSALCSFVQSSLKFEKKMVLRLTCARHEAMRTHRGARMASHGWRTLDIVSSLTQGGLRFLDVSILSKYER